MAEQVSDRHQTDAGAHQVSCESVAQAMRRERNTNATALTPSAYAFVDGAP